MPLYKYRSLNNFKHFVDIIINNRLFAARYFQLNDPMEGQYIHSEGVLSKDVINAIKGEKDKIRICSLSRTPANALMWSHYADGHRGVVFEVLVDPDIYDVRAVDYEGLSNVHNNIVELSNETAKRILCHKYHMWGYEEEERVFTTDGSKFIDVCIKRIILGSRMSNQDKSLIRRLSSNLPKAIKVDNSNVEDLFQ